MKKTTTKKTKKQTKPKYTVDLRGIETFNDIDVAFGLAKHKAGLPISNDELEAIVFDAYEMFGPKITIVDCNCECPTIKKKPWYKRFWNWLFGKK